MRHDSDILKRIKGYFMRRKNAEEAHRFEREMERDVFLYEAVEGFEDMHVSDLQQALDELDDRLDKKSHKGFAWWRAAAAVLVIAAGVSVFAILNSGDGMKQAPEETVVKEDARERLEKTGEPLYEPRLTQPLYDELDGYADSIPAVATTEGDKTTVMTPFEEEITNTKDLKKEERPEPLKVPQHTIVNSTAPSGTYNSPQVANPFSADEIAGNETMLEPEENQAVVATEDVEKLSPALLQEVAISSKAQSNRKSAAPAKPSGGMASYRQYLNNNLQKSEGMPSGTVIVTFEFDKDGKPKKVEVAKSLCTACDAEAKRLIENGPAWDVEDRKERATIEVVFP